MADTDDPIAVALNTRPKYVASTMLTDPGWANTPVLSGDVAAAVVELQVVGSLSVVRLLLENDLVDQIVLLTYPVVVGQGRRLFPDSGPDTALELVESRVSGENGASRGISASLEAPFRAPPGLPEKSRRDYSPKFSHCLHSEGRTSG